MFQVQYYYARSAMWRVASLEETEEMAQQMSDQFAADWECKTRIVPEGDHAWLPR